MVHKTWCDRCIQPTTNRKRRRMENSLSNEIWTLWILGYAIWAYQRTSIVSTIHQRGIRRASRYLCDSLPWWHLDLLKHSRRTCPACPDDTAETWKCQATIEVEEMWIPCSRNWILGTLDHYRRNPDGQEQSPSHPGLACTEEHQRSPTVYRIGELLPTISERLFTIHDAIVQNAEKRTRVPMGTRATTSISASQGKNCICTSSCAVWPRKGNYDWNRCIRLRHWHENDSARIWWKTTSHRIPFTKVSSSGIELRHPWQRIASYSGSIQDLESLPGRCTTHSTCENRPQEPDLLHNNQRVDSKTGQMGWNTFPIWFQDRPLQRKWERTSRCT